MGEERKSEQKGEKRRGGVDREKNGEKLTSAKRASSSALGIARRPLAGAEAGSGA